MLASAPTFSKLIGKVPFLIHNKKQGVRSISAQPDWIGLYRLRFAMSISIRLQNQTPFANVRMQSLGISREITRRADQHKNQQFGILDFRN